MPTDEVGERIEQPAPPVDPDDAPNPAESLAATIGVVDEPTAEAAAVKRAAKAVKKAEKAAKKAVKKAAKSIAAEAGPVAKATAPVAKAAPPPAPVEPPPPAAPAHAPAAKKAAKVAKAEKAAPPKVVTGEKVENADKAVKKAAKAAAKADKAAAKASAPPPPPAPPQGFGTIWVAPDGIACPPSHPVKAKMASRLYHLPGFFAYDRTRPDRCYIDAERAEADGLAPGKR